MDELEEFGEVNCTYYEVTDHDYETQPMDYTRLQSFKAFLDKEIGTEYDVNDEGDGTYYLMVFDLMTSEVKQIRDFENEMFLHRVDIAEN